MIKSILKNWTWIRFAYLFIGVWMMVQSGIEGQWLGIALGAWPAAMGLFGVGCAGGSCAMGNCGIEPDTDHKSKTNN